MLFSLLQADTALALSQSAEVTPVPQEMSISIIDMAIKGGWLMIVLLLLSIIAIYIFGKKLWVINRASKVDKNFLEDVKDYIHDGKIKSAITYSGKFDTPVARLVEKGIARIGRPLADIQSSIEIIANLEVARLEKGLPLLATIAGGAPMIGFLGTVTGMVRAFFNLAFAVYYIDRTLLSSGFYEAMITTDGGLIVGILAYFGYNYLVNRISDAVFDLENATIQFLDVLNDPEVTAQTTKEVE